MFVGFIKIYNSVELKIVLKSKKFVESRYTWVFVSHYTIMCNGKNSLNFLEYLLSNVSSDDVY